MQDSDSPPSLSELGLLDAASAFGLTREEALSLALGSYIERDGRRYRVIEIRRGPVARVLVLRARDDSPSRPANSTQRGRP